MFMKGSLRIFADYFQAACLDKVGWALVAHSFRVLRQPETAWAASAHSTKPIGFIIIKGSLRNLIDYFQAIFILDLDQTVTNVTDSDINHISY